MPVVNDLTTKLHCVCRIKVNTANLLSLDGMTTNSEVGSDNSYHTVALCLSVSGLHLLQ